MTSPAAPIDEAPLPAAAVRHARFTKRRLLLIAAVAAAVLAATLSWLVHRGIESTDDAQIDAEVVAVPARVAGTVLRVRFHENQSVKRGELLAELDDAQAKAKLAQAEANLSAAMAAADAADADTSVVETNARGDRAMAEASLRSSSVGAAATTDQIHEGEAAVASAEATLKQADTELARTKQLVASGAYTQAMLDRAQTAYDVANTSLAAARARLATLQLSQAQAKSRVAEASAKLQQASNVDVVVRKALARRASAHAEVDIAKAARDLAALELSYTKIYAPHAGVVSKKVINEGQAVAVGQPVVQLVPPERWVTANFKETQLAHMHAGQRARFTVDAYPDLELEGEVESFSAATGARFALLPPDNATGNFTKIVQRVPVRVRVKSLPRGVALRPGMSVELSVDTRDRG